MHSYFIQCHLLFRKGHIMSWLIYMPVTDTTEASQKSVPQTRSTHRVQSGKSQNGFIPQS